MTLKELFVSMVRLLLGENGSEESDEYLFELNEKGCRVQFCSNSDCKVGEHNWYGRECMECNGEGVECPYQVKRSVDLIFNNYHEGNCININVEKEKDPFCNITTINNHDDLINVLSIIKGVIDKPKNYDLNAFYRYEELMQYAHEFFKQVIVEVFKGLSEEILPITFYEGSISYSEESKTGIVRCGNLSFNGKQNKIAIYNIMKEDIHELKRTIKHEILHFCLYSHSNNLDYDDNTATFWTIAEYYDAHPYVQLEGHQLELYEKAKTILACHDEVARTKDFKKLNMLNLLVSISKYNEDVFRDYFDKTYDNMIEARDAVREIVSLQAEINSRLTA